MSRVGKMPISIPDGVKVLVEQQIIKVTGPLGSLSFILGNAVTVSMVEGQIVCSPVEDEPNADAMSGTTRALLSNMVVGVSKGFEKRLALVGVGFRAQAQAEKLNLQIGFSHPVVQNMPEGVRVNTPTPTEIVISGPDAQVVGQIAAEIRACRPPEPYKGKGIRYLGEKIVLKETKKK